jgi:hypothetical protein
MSTNAAQEKFRREVREALKRSREAFEGEYKEQLDELLALSRADIDGLTPDTTDLQTYDKLISIVREASRHNVAQAELRARITELGVVGLNIVGKVPSLAALVHR